MKGPAPAGRRWHLLRRCCQVAVLLLGVAAPWSDGFRLDIPAGSFLWLGQSYPLEWPQVLRLIIPFVGIVWALALLSWLKGRVFCGWACPYGSLVELCEGLRTALGLGGANRKVAAWMRRSAGHRWALRAGALLTLVAGPLVLGASLAAYLEAPARILHDLSRPLNPADTGQVALWVWLGLTLLASWVAGFLVRFHFCRMVCIYGMGQAMAASSRAPEKILRPRYRPKELSACGNCKACLKACFLELDPRDPQLRLGFSSGCFNCGDCLEVCATVQKHQGQASLLSFETGSQPARPSRQREASLED